MSISYLLVGERLSPEVFTDDGKLKRPTLSGLYCWATAFGEFGKSNIDVVLSRDFLEDYDIVHLNYVHSSGSILYRLREQLQSSDTKLVVNVDHAVSMWNGFDLVRMRKELNLADVVFHVEPVGAKLLSHLLDRKVEVLPHPVDDIEIRRLVAGKKINYDRLWDIACQYHRYHMTNMVYHVTYREKMENGTTVALLNYTHDDVVRMNHVKSHFTTIVNRTNYDQYITEILPRARVVVDLPPDYVGGRGVADCFMLGIPVISSNTVYLARMIMPKLVVDQTDIHGIRMLTDLLLDNDDVYEEISDEVQRVCEKVVGLEPSYNAMLKICGLK